VSYFGTRGAGFAGNPELGLPSGGGAFQVPAGPINPATYGNNGRISLFDPSMVDADGDAKPSPAGPGSAWSSVFQQLTLLGGSALLSRLAKRDSPGNRSVPEGSKGEIGSVIATTPAHDGFDPFGELFGAPGADAAKPGGGINWSVIVPLAAAGLLLVAFLMRR